MLTFCPTPPTQGTEEQGSAAASLPQPSSAVAQAAHAGHESCVGRDTPSLCW